MSIVTPLEGKEGVSTVSEDDDDVLKRLDIITQRVKFGVEELNKRRKRTNNNINGSSSKEKQNSEKDLSELLEKEVVENRKNVRVDVKKG